MHADFVEDLVDFIIDFCLTTEINTGLQKLKVSLSCINVDENRSMDNPNLNTPLVFGVFYGANMIKFFSLFIYNNLYFRFFLAHARMINSICNISG